MSVSGENYVDDSGNIYDWGTDEWIMSSSETIDQFFDRIKIMDQLLGTLEVPSREIEGLLPIEIRTLPMEFYGEKFTRKDTITLERNDRNSMDPNAIIVYQNRGGHKLRVSYVCKENSKYVRYIPDFHKKTLKLVEVHDTWAKFRFC